VSRSEWARVCARVAAWWPHSPWPDVSAAAYYADLQDLPADVVAAACEALYRDAREFPPTGGQIRAKAVELGADLPTWPETLDLLNQAARRFLGVYGVDEALAWLDSQHPLVGQFARMLPFRDFCLTEEPQVFHGQARRMWEQLSDRTRRDASYRGIQPARLRALKRANSEPRQLGVAIGQVLELDRGKAPA
jgi:hypothetical protein